MIQGYQIFPEEKMLSLLYGSYKILEESGFQIDHEYFLNLFKKNGMKVDYQKKRVRLEKSFIEKILKPTGNSIPISHITDVLLPEYHVGGTYPKYFDHKMNRTVLGDESIFLDNIRIFNNISDFSEIDRPVAVSDFPSATEAIESTALLIKHCPKPGRGEVGRADNIPYLVKLGEIYTGEKNSTFFVAPWTFVIPPLKISHEEGEMILQRSRYFTEPACGSMISSGITAPINREGSIAIELAEAIAVWLCYKLVNPEIKLYALFASSTFDMKKGSCVFASPGAVVQDAACSQILSWYFDARTDIAPNYVEAKVPGMQTIYEKLFKNFAVFTYTGQFSFDAGLLEAGNTFSPLQAIIDLEMWKSIRAVYSKEPKADQSIPFTEINEVLNANDNFLTSAHTLEHMKDYEDPCTLFDRESKTAEDFLKAVDNSLLERAGAILDNLDKESEPYAADKALSKEVDGIVAHARKTIIDS